MQQDAPVARRPFSPSLHPMVNSPPGMKMNSPRPGPSISSLCLLLFDELKGPSVQERPHCTHPTNSSRLGYTNR